MTWPVLPWWRARHSSHAADFALSLTQFRLCASGRSATKPGGFEDIDTGVRAFILITVAIVCPTLEFGFEIGAFGRLFYDKVFVDWGMLTALYVLLVIMPKEKPSVAKFARIAVGENVIDLVAAGFVSGRRLPRSLPCEDLACSGNYCPADFPERRRSRTVR